jgi:hypothetical protein
VSSTLCEAWRGLANEIPISEAKEMIRKIRLVFISFIFENVLKQSSKRGEKGILISFAI